MCQYGQVLQDKPSLKETLFRTVSACALSTAGQKTGRNVLVAEMANQERICYLNIFKDCNNFLLFSEDNTVLTIEKAIERLD